MTDTPNPGLQHRSEYPNTKDQEAWDVLTTALEGGYAEEFLVVDFKRDHERGHVITWARLKVDPYNGGIGDDRDHQVWDVDASFVRSGFRRYTAWVKEHDPAHRSYLGEQWAIAHDPEGDGWAELDAIGADAVLQFACFGEVVFG
jgi:hypothetical protein